MNASDPWLWLGTILSFSMIVFSGIAVYVGATALKSPAWAWCMRQLALYEIQLRASGREGDLLPADLLAAERMAGAREISMPSDDELDGHVAATLRLIGLSGSVAAAQQLDDEARRWLRWSLAMQVRAVRGRVRLVEASRRWRVRHWVSSTRVGLASLRWFGPLWLRHVGSLAAPLLGGAAVIGAWFGLLAWFVGRHVVFRSDHQYVDWTVVVGWWGSVACAVALVKLSMSQMWLLWHAQRRVEEPPSRARFFAALAAYLAVCSALFIVSGSGILDGWWRSSAAVAESVGRQLGSSQLVGGLVIIAVLGYLIRNCVTWIRNRALRPGQRVEFAGALVLLLLMAATAGVYAADGSVDVLPAIWLAGGSALVLVMVVSAAIDISAFSRRYRQLRTAGWPVARRGFSIWALVAWLAAAGLLMMLETVLRTVPPQLTSTWMVNIIYLWMSAVTLALFVLAIPGAVVTWLFIRRVDAEHAKWAYACAGDKRREPGQRTGNGGPGQDQPAPGQVPV